MGKKWRVKKWDRKILAVATVAIILVAGSLTAWAYSAKKSNDTQKIHNGSQPTKVEGLNTVKSKPGKDAKNSHSSHASQTLISNASETLAPEHYNLSNIKAGVYLGPGAVSAHGNFEKWLGKTIPYSTDYIPYGGGWDKDFEGSNSWLVSPWGSWVKQGNRRLVLGVPMLENSNYGQFDQGASGQFDKYFTDLANNLVSNSLGNSIIRLGYEANCDTIGPWQATDNPAGYKNLFRHEVSVMRSVQGSSFLFDWTVCNGLQNGKALTSFDSFYPGDDVVDIAGMDIYDVKWQDSRATPQSRWNYLFSRSLGINELLSFSRAHSKAVSYPEWGLYRPGDNFAGGGDDPYFIQKMALLFSNTQPLYQSYFDIDWGGGAMTDFNLGQSQYKSIFGI